MGKNAAETQGKQRVAHVIEICGECDKFDMDESSPGCPGRVRACEGPYPRDSRWHPQVTARRLAALARAGRIPLIGGSAAN